MSKFENSVSKYRKTPKGLITNLYHKLKERNTVSFDLKFLQSYLEDKKFQRLFKEWEKSNYNKNKKPSIDRISYKKGYEIGNIHWITWEENRYKQRMELKSIKAKKVGRFLNGILIEEYKSVSDAVAKFGVAQGNLSSCLNGKRKKVKGFEWKYIDHKPQTSSKHIKICKNCKKEFISYNPKQYSCSRQCGATGNNNAKNHRQHIRKSRIIRKNILK